MDAVPIIRSVFLQQPTDHLPPELLYFAPGACHYDWGLENTVISPTTRGERAALKEWVRVVGQ